MKYSNPIKKIMERELARIEGKNHDGPTRVVGEIGRLHSAVQSLEAVVLNRDPSHNDAMHMKKSHEAGARLAKAVEATRHRANEILSAYNGSLSEKLMDRTGLRPPEKLEGIMRQSELRTVVRSLDDEKRRDVLRDAVKAKDSDTLSALFNASPLVTGIDPNFLREMRNTYEKAVAPDVIDEMNELLETDNALQAVARTAEKVAKDSQDEQAMQAFIRAQEASEQAKESFTAAMQEQAQ